MVSIVVDAIANSTYQNIEIIAVNDGSTDGTKDVLGVYVVLTFPLIWCENAETVGTFAVDPIFGLLL